jgi:4-amino-4-deoxy-L-arabinose transferase-like glycosyltransferase
MSRRIDLWLALSLFFASFALRMLIAAGYQFDGLYGQDSFAYFDFAQDIIEGYAPGKFFYPLGYTVLLAAGFAVFGASAQVGQIINLLLGGALAPLAYILARQTGCERFGAVVAAILVLACGQVFQSSIILMSDIPTLFWTSLSATFLLHYRETSRARWLAFSALTLALASITRWLALSLALPWTLTVLLIWRRRIRWRNGLVAALAALLIFVPQILYSFVNPQPILTHHWVEGWSLRNIFQREFNNVDGYFLYEQINAIFYAQVFYNAYYLAPIFAPFLLLGAGVILKERRFAVALILLGWILIPFIFLVGIPYQNIRYPLIIFPPAAVLAGIGLETVVKWMQELISKRLAARVGPRPAPTTNYVAYMGAAVFIVTGLVQTANASQPIIHTFITNQQRDRALAEWAQANIPSGATLYTFGVTLTLQHYTTLDVYEIFYETPETLAERWAVERAAGESGNDYLLLNVWDVNHQWDGREPQIAYQWLQDERGLIPMSRFGNFTLFKIAP